MLPSINYVSPIVSNGMKRTPFASSGFEVKWITNGGKPLFYAQIILGTPLFMVDVFQWARFRHSTT